MITEKPMTVEEIEDNIKKNGRIVVNVRVSLADLISMGIESLNEHIERIICPDDYTLEDMSYLVVGSMPADEDEYIGGTVIIRVNAAAEKF